MSIALKTFSEKSKKSHFYLKMGQATQYILMWNVPFVKHNSKKTPFSDRLSDLYALLYTKKLDMPESYNTCNLLFFYLFCFQANFKHICDAIKQNESELEKIHFLFFSIFYWDSIQVLIWWKPHIDWAIGSKDMNSWRVAKTIGNKRNYLLCLAIS